MTNEKGFTLIELVLTIAILTLSVGVTTDIILAITRSYTKTQITNEIEQNSNYVLLKLEKELRNASSVTTPATGGTSNTLLFIDDNGNTITYVVNTGTGIITRCVNNAACAAGTQITNSDTINGVSVTCSGSCFSNIASSPTVIRLNMTFSQRGSPSTSFTGSVTLNNTIVVRGTY